MIWKQLFFFAGIFDILRADFKVPYGYVYPPSVRKELLKAQIILNRTPAFILLLGST